MCGLLFSPIDSVLHLKEALQSYEVPFVMMLFLILEHKILVFYSGNFTLYPCPQGSPPLSFLLVSVLCGGLWGSVYVVLWGDPWSTWTWAFYSEIRMDQLPFFFMLTSSWTSTICWKCCIFPLESFSTFVKDQVTLWFISGSSILFHWSTCLSLYQYHAAFNHNCSVVQLNVRHGDSTRGYFIVENSFHYPGFFVILNEFENWSF